MDRWEESSHNAYIYQITILYTLLNFIGYLYLETNENGNTTLPNLWDAAKAVLRGKFIATKAFLKKKEKSQLNNLTYHLKEIEKEQTNKQKSPKSAEEGNNKDQRRNN